MTQGPLLLFIAMVAAAMTMVAAAGAEAEPEVGEAPEWMDEADVRDFIVAHRDVVTALSSHEGRAKIGPLHAVNEIGPYILNVDLRADKQTFFFNELAPEVMHIQFAHAVGRSAMLLPVAKRPQLQVGGVLVAVGESRARALGISHGGIGEMLSQRSNFHDGRSVPAGPFLHLFRSEHFERIDYSTLGSAGSSEFFEGIYMGSSAADAHRFHQTPEADRHGVLFVQQVVAIEEVSLVGKEEEEEEAGVSSHIVVLLRTIPIEHSISKARVELEMNVSTPSMREHRWPGSSHRATPLRRQLEEETLDWSISVFDFNTNSYRNGPDESVLEYGNIECHNCWGFIGAFVTLVFEYEQVCLISFWGNCVVKRPSYLSEVGVTSGATLDIHGKVEAPDNVWLPSTTLRMWQYPAAGADDDGDDAWTNKYPIGGGAFAVNFQLVLDVEVELGGRIAGGASASFDMASGQRMGVIGTKSYQSAPMVWREMDPQMHTGPTYSYEIGELQSLDAILTPTFTANIGLHAGNVAIFSSLSLYSYVGLQATFGVSMHITVSADRRRERHHRDLLEAPVLNSKISLLSPVSDDVTTYSTYTDGSTVFDVIPITFEIQELNAANDSDVVIALLNDQILPNDTYLILDRLNVTEIALECASKADSSKCRHNITVPWHEEISSCYSSSCAGGEDDFDYCGEWRVRAFLENDALVAGESEEIYILPHSHKSGHLKNPADGQCVDYGENLNITWDPKDEAFTYYVRNSTATATGEFANLSPLYVDSSNGLSSARAYPQRVSLTLIGMQCNPYCDEYNPLIALALNNESIVHQKGWLNFTFTESMFSSLSEDYDVQDLQFMIVIASVDESFIWSWSQGTFLIDGCNTRRHLTGQQQQWLTGRRYSGTAIDKRTMRKAKPAGTTATASATTTAIAIATKETAPANLKSEGRRDLPLMSPSSSPSSWEEAVRRRMLSLTCQRQDSWLEISMLAGITSFEVLGFTLWEGDLGTTFDIAEYELDLDIFRSCDAEPCYDAYWNCEAYRTECDRYFCDTCDYSGYCDQTCSLCGQRRNLQVQEEAVDSSARTTALPQLFQASAEHSAKSVHRLHSNVERDHVAARNRLPAPFAQHVKDSSSRNAKAKGSSKLAPRLTIERLAQLQSRAPPKPLLGAPLRVHSERERIEHSVIAEKREKILLLKSISSPRSGYSTAAARSRSGDRGRSLATSSQCTVTNTDWLGDGFCDSDMSTGSYNSMECGYDGGDCCVQSCNSTWYTCGASSNYSCADPKYSGSCSVADITWLGDGYCDSGSTGYNTAACDWDSGDCCAQTCVSTASYTCGVDSSYSCSDPEYTSTDDDDFANYAYYYDDTYTDDDDHYGSYSYGDDDDGTCSVSSPSFLGDGYCDISGSYNTEACDWDNGDCCPSTCVDSVFTCGANGWDCRDPSAGDDDSLGCEDTYSYCSWYESSCDEYFCSNCTYAGWCDFTCGVCSSDLSACDATNSHWVGDGWCDMYDTDVNSADCEYDGGDCCEDTCSAGALYSCGIAGYDCQNPNSSFYGFVTDDDDFWSWWDDDWDDDSWGDNSTASIPANCHVPYPEYISDGWCDGGVYNSANCSWDGGDCCSSTCTPSAYSCGVNGFSCEDPDASTEGNGCSVDYPSWLGDGYCDGGEYNEPGCQYDFGDCCASTCQSSAAGYPCGTAGYDCLDPNATASNSTGEAGQCEDAWTGCAALSGYCASWFCPTCVYSGVCNATCGYCGLLAAGFCTVPTPDFVGDGWCDRNGGYNTPLCSYDGGDCCSKGCTPGLSYTCGSNGFDCLDPEYAGNSTCGGLYVNGFAATLLEDWLDEVYVWQDAHQAYTWSSGDIDFFGLPLQHPTHVYVAKNSTLDARFQETGFTWVLTSAPLSTFAYSSGDVLYATLDTAYADLDMAGKRDFLELPPNGATWHVQLKSGAFATASNITMTCLEASELQDDGGSDADDTFSGLQQNGASNLDSKVHVRAANDDDSEDCNVLNPDFIGDGFCDGCEYNHAGCDYDGGDCCSASCTNSALYDCTTTDENCLDPDYSPYSTTTLAGCSATALGDGWCDTKWNTETCDYDGGDCCSSSCVSSTYECGAGGYDCLDTSVTDDDGNDDDDDDDEVGGNGDDYDDNSSGGGSDSLGTLVAAAVGGVVVIAAVSTFLIYRSRKAEVPANAAATVTELAPTMPSSPEIVMVNNPVSVAQNLQA